MDFSKVVEREGERKEKAVRSFTDFAGVRCVGRMESAWVCSKETCQLKDLSLINFFLTLEQKINPPDVF